MAIAISLKNISKSFRRGKVRGNFSYVVGRMVNGNNSGRIDALKNIDIDIEKGENVAVIGRNGSGKSTLLRVVSGILVPDSGRVMNSGEVHYLSGINFPINRQLTGLENIKLMGVLYDFPKKRIEESISTIRDFSGLYDRLDDVVFSYSDGMIGRLSFSIYSQLIWKKSMDILVFDEVFAGGADEEFKKKVQNNIDEVLSGGSTVLMATHNLDGLEKRFARTIYLEKGQIKFLGDTKEAIKRYKEE